MLLPCRCVQDHRASLFDWQYIVGEGNASVILRAAKDLCPRRFFVASLLRMTALLRPYERDVFAVPPCGAQSLTSMILPLTAPGVLYSAKASAARESGKV